ncbi:MAG: hypothetical protein ABF449_11435 [Ethanoligenens sp.]
MESNTESIRQNAGYTILQARKVGDQEIVLGENLKAPDPYVTWMCRNGNDYNFGHYCSTMLSASRDFMKRVNRELNLPKDKDSMRCAAPKTHDEPER